MYSQNDEEKVILDLFKDQPTGRLLDIGAFDGKTFSNSLALIEKGWRAVLVEPNPTSLVALINLHGTNRNVEIVGALVSPEPGLQEMFTCQDAVSTTNPDFKPMWEQIGVKFNPVWFPALHPGVLCHGHTFDFITLDVEDGTLAIVEAMLGAFSTCKVACVEHSVGTNVVKKELMEIFVDRLAFRLVHTTGENFIFAKP
jgi:FkbM family methyltransferase